MGAILAHMDTIVSCETGAEEHTRSKGRLIQSDSMRLGVTVKLMLMRSY
jgi:hypothetical protein